MRIGINTLFMVPGKHGGGEQYVRELLINLAKIDSENEYIIFTNKSNAGSFGVEQDNFTEVLCSFPVRFKILRILWEQVVLPFQVKKHRIDVLHSLVNVSPIIKLASCKYIVTIHDVMYRYHPENYPKGQLAYLRLLSPLSARKVDKIITVSQTSKKDIVESLAVAKDKVAVIYTSGLSDRRRYDLNNEQVKDRIKNKYGLNGSFILCVASLNPQKNTEGLLRAFYLAKKKFRFDCQLVLVGMLLSNISKLKGIVSELGLDGDVIFTGYVSDEDLFYLYSLADLYVLPSTFEGLGVTPLEAMACRCPVVSSDIAAIREVVGGAAALFNPCDEQEMAETIHRVLTNDELRNELIRKGLQRIQQFSWGKTAIETLKIFEEVKVK